MAESKITDKNICHEEGDNGDRQIELKVETLGNGEPSHAVVACVHGEEPCGYRAIQKLKNSTFEVEGAVKLIIAHEKARKENVRYIEKDLNRCFPGDPESDVYEERLAAKVLEEIDGLTVLDLHATKSEPTPFAFYIGNSDLIEKAGVNVGVDLSYMPETMMNYMNGISIECGHPESNDAAETAYQIAINFLAAEGVINAGYRLSDPDLFEITGEVMGEEFKFEAENFQKVREGDVFAVNGMEMKVAKEDFYPVLMSTDGYDHKIGYKGQKINEKNK